MQRTFDFLKHKEMKKVEFLFFGLLTLFSLGSCKDNPDAVPHSYDLFLEFRDENGSNRLNDFDAKQLKNDVTIKIDGGEILKANYSIIENNSEKKLLIHSSSLQKNKSARITYTINNEELMGDLDRHILETEWIVSNNNSAIINLSLNGNPISPIKENNFSYYVITK